MRPFKTYAELKKHIADIIGKYIVSSESDAGIDTSIPVEHIEKLYKEVLESLRGFIIGTCLEATAEQSIDQLIEIVTDIPCTGDPTIDSEARSSLLQYLKENRNKYPGLAIKIPKNKKVVLRGRGVCLVGSFTRPAEVIESRLANRGAYIEEYQSADILVYGNQTTLASTGRFIERAHQKGLSVLSEDDLIELLERRKPVHDDDCSYLDG